MSASKSTLTADELRELLDYDPKTGTFTWKTGRCAGKSAGTPVGNHRYPQRYLRIQVLGKGYRAHRLAWLYVTGEWPPEQIDHIDSDGRNNSFENLRLATAGQQAANRRTSKFNKLRVRGVRQLSSGAYSARIMCKGKRIWLGSYKTIDEARAVRIEAERELFGEFAPR